MAHNREWDKGKDGWTDEGWSARESAPDEDYRVDGKRRKYNNGGYGGQTYDEDGPSVGEYAQDYYEDRPRGQGRKRLVASEPSPHVIFLGLDPDFTEADLQAYLTSQDYTIESVTIIRDRSTGASKGFGFAQFATTEHARAFVDPLFPFIQIPPPASHGASATAAFYKALETGGPHAGRRVKIDYSQSANPSDKPRRLQSMNDGTRDIGNTQSALLLFRGLDPLSGPQAIAQAMKSSAGPGKEGAKGMRRIILIKDRVTLASWGFAFVEFVEVQAASAVLGATMSPQIHPAGFCISERPVAASFAQIYSFQPVDAMHRDEACISSTTVLGGFEGGWVRYWDEASTIAVLEFQVQEAPKQNPAPAPTKEKKKKGKQTGETTTAMPEASILPLSDKPVTLSFNKAGLGKPGLTTGKVNAAAFLGFNATDEAGTGEDEDLGVDPANMKVASARKVAPMIASKKVANNINKWNQVQEILSQPEASGQAAPVQAAPVQDGSAASSTADIPPIATVVDIASTTALSLHADFEFADPNTLICLLCARQFKTTDQLKRHNKGSDLHKKNLQNTALCATAREKVAAAAARPSQASETSTKPPEAPRYRDRASERRVMHNQPDVPLPETSKASKKRVAEGPPPPPSPPPPPKNPGEDDNNVGNKLLKMMGWKEGTGLGTHGEGRVDPIQTAIYAQGAGLGASKGKEIGKYEPGYAGYLQRGQDTARERYGT